MPGWIIQGVRGEGKSLCAVGKIKEYMARGCPVATNLDLFLDKLLPSDNSTIAYRLPDHPRLEDFQILPPAYDPKYKGEDHNGLLVLDELGTWLNSRNWSDKTRLKLLNWLFLSRKDHWDVILLAQDFEMIDVQVRTTLCDYLVQSSRLDRQKIPYLSGALKFFGFSGKMPSVHRYHVFYGMSLASPPQETWSFTGHDIWHGYNTNQKFMDGYEPLDGTLVDMRATYSYLPASYLSNHVHIERLQQQVTELKQGAINRFKTIESEVKTMKKGVGTETSYLKIGLLALALLVFVGWRVFSGFSMPKGSDLMPVTAVNASVMPAVIPALAPEIQAKPDYKPAMIETPDFIDYLIAHYRPRLSVTAYSEEQGFFGNIEFYDKGVIVEQYSIKVLHALGVALVRKDYGADLVYKGKTFIVTAWKLVKQTVEPAKLQKTAIKSDAPPA